jgi:hypothetical protein
MMKSRTSSDSSYGQLFDPITLPHPELYKRLQSKAPRAQFRKEFAASLRVRWRTLFSRRDAKRAMTAFERQCDCLQKYGAIAFCNMITDDAFEAFIVEYDRLIAGLGAV